MRLLILTLLSLIFFSSCKQNNQENIYNKKVDSVLVLVNMLNAQIKEIANRKAIRDTLIIKNDKKAQNEFKKVDKFNTVDLRRVNDSIERSISTN